MTPFELDDCMHALKKTIAFYDKRLTDDQTGFWRAYVKKQDPKLFKRALVEYYETGKFCPKPSDIADVLARIKENEAGRAGYASTSTTLNVEPAPPEVARAWAYWIGTMWDSGLFKAKKVAPDDAMSMLKLINRQVKESGNLDAIAPNFRIREILGEGVPEHEIMVILNAGA